MNTLHFFFNFFHSSESSGHQLNSPRHVNRVTGTIFKNNQISSAKMFTVSSKRKLALPMPKELLPYFILHSTINFLYCKEGASVAVLSLHT